MSLSLLGSDVDIDFARETGGRRRCAEIGIVKKDHYRLFLRAGTSNDVLVRHAAEARQLPGLSGVRTRHNTCPGAARGGISDFFSVEKNPSASSEIVGQKNALGRQGPRAKPLA